MREHHDAPSRRWGWIGLALATTAAAALIVTTLVRSSQTPGGSLERTEIARHDDVVLRPPASGIDDPSAPPSSTSRVAIERPSARVAAHADATPEIVIDPAMTDAIRRMSMSIRNSAPDPSVAETLRTETASTALTAPDPLMVPEIVLKPADQNGGDQTPFEQDEE